MVGANVGSITEPLCGRESRQYDLYTVWYNWVRIHKTLKVTPVMAAGLTGSLMNMEDVVALIDVAAPKPGRPKAYKKRPVQQGA